MQTIKSIGNQEVIENLSPGEIPADRAAETGSQQQSQGTHERINIIG